MTPDFGRAARKLLADRPGEDSSEQLAARASQACEQFVRHLARLLGDTGVRLLLKRSVMRASEQFPWLAAAPIAETGATALRVVMEQQDSESITEAFVAVLSAFVGLLERLIGEGLVERLLAEVWPAVFTHAAKDTP